MQEFACQASQIKYQVKGQIETREEVIESEKIKAGRFILATNVLDKNELSDEQVLEEYKAQQSNERGFRFLNIKIQGQLPSSCFHTHKNNHKAVTPRYCEKS